MGIFSWLKPKTLIKKTTYQELGTYQARFTGFGNNIYESDVIRSCIRPLAEHSSKANAVVSSRDPQKKKELEKLINENPNVYMNGKDFLSKVRTRLEVLNTAFILITRDDTGKCIGLYPVPYSDFVAVEYNNNIYIEFHFLGTAARTLTFAWEDLAVLRKDYLNSDIAGDSNNAILHKLELIHVTDQGIENAVKATANLRGILKNTKGMLNPEDIKKQKDIFVRDYLNLGNAGGIASLDASQEFTPIEMKPTVTGWETLEAFRKDVQRYYGVSDSIIHSDYTEEQMEAFYDARIEPFLVALSLELTRKIFTERERGYDNQIVYESNRIQYASTKTKLSLVQMVDRGAMTPNEWRSIFNLAPVEGGDVPIRRLDTAEVVTTNETTKNEEEE